jgi:hypothetical protein
VQMCLVTFHSTSKMQHLARWQRQGNQPTTTSDIRDGKEIADPSLKAGLVCSSQQKV